MNETEFAKREPSRWLRWMPNWLEFGLIFWLTLWPFVYASLNAVFTTLPDAPITEAHLGGLYVSEIIVLVLVIPLMQARGWTIRMLRLEFEQRDLVRALIILLLAYVGYYTTWFFFWIIMPDHTNAAVSAKLVGSSLGIGTILAASVINGFFEELFVAGYLIQSLRTRFGVTTAVNVSVLVRLSYHLYQGGIGVIGIVPMGLVFAWGFVRVGRLWPLILAHIAADIIALGMR